MQHQAHIRAIDPHAKGDGGHQHRLGLLLKLLQRQQATLRIHAGVIRQGWQPGLTQLGRPTLHPAAGAAVDQHRSAGPAGFRQHQLQRIFRAPEHAIAQVGALG